MRFRSLLNIPLNRFDKAIYQRLDLEADALVLDLEDAIAVADKKMARENLKLAINHFKNPHIFVRINSDENFEEDFSLIKELGIKGIVYPKFDRHHKLSLEDISVFNILVVIETPLGLYYMHETLSQFPNLKGVIFGPEDLSAALGIEPSQNNMTSYAQQVVLVSKLLNVPCYGYASDFTFLSVSKLIESCYYAKSLGLKGVPCIHPSHLKHINEIFSVKTPKIKEFIGITSANGKMMGPPTIKRLKNL